MNLPSVDTVLAKLAALGIQLPTAPVRLGAYGDSPEMSSELLALIRDGRKRAGSSLMWAYEAEGEPVPNVGELEVVVDHHFKPALVTRAKHVEVVPFDQVGHAYAATEGEGDRSLEFWRAAHWAFFSRECARLGRSPSRTMPVLCCVFEVLHVLQQEATRLFVRRRSINASVRVAHSPRVRRSSPSCPMNATLRVAISSDAESIAEVLLSSRAAFLPYARLAHTDGEVRTWVRAVLLPSEAVTVAVVNGQVIGVLALAQDDGISWLTQLYLHPAHVAQGIGSRLLAHAIATALPLIRLYTFQQNVGARRFYERNGFVPVEFTNGIANEEQCPDVLYELAFPRFKNKSTS